MQAKIKTPPSLHYKLQIIPAMQLGVGHILLKTGSWDEEDSGLNKDVMVVATMNAPEGNFLQDSGQSF